MNFSVPTEAFIVLSMIVRAWGNGRDAAEKRDLGLYER